MISHGVPAHGQRGVEGLASPDGLAWEITFQGGLSPTSRKHLAEHTVRQEASGYECHLVTLGEVTYFVERYAHGNALRFWDGLVLTGEWDMSGSCPWQGTATALWTRPDRAGVEGVTLYLRHRDYGIDSDGTLWTGHVQRHDGSDIFAGIRAPWSPNLLPTVVPRDVPVQAVPSTIGFFQIGRPPSVELGFLEDDEEGAKRALVKKAEAWLRENGMRDEAWDYCVSPRP